MIEGGSLILVAAAIYLFECLVPVGRESVAFLTRVGTRARPAFGNRLPGLRAAGWAMVFPLPPLGRVFICHRWPASLSPEAAFAYTAQAPNPGVRPPQTERLVRFPAAGRAVADGAEVRLDGDLFAAAGAPALARRLADLLRELAALPAERRAAAIERALEAAFDADAIAETVAGHRDRVRPLAIAGNAVWLWLFAVAPAVLAWRGLAASWRALLIGLLLFTVWATVEFWLAHRGLYPRHRAERCLAAIGHLCAPPIAIRSLDRLTRDLLADRDPVAAAAVLCPRPEALALAERALRDARNPLPPVCPGDDPAAQRTERWFRERRLAALERFVERRFGTAAADLAGPPAPETPASRFYCPRCTGQYLVEAPECAGCPGIALLPLPAAGPPDEPEAAVLRAP